VKATKTLKGLGGFLLPYKWALIASCVLAAAKVVFTLSIPVQVGRAIDAISEGAFTVRYLYFIVGAAICAGVTVWLMNVLANKVTFGLTRNIREMAFAKILHLPMSYIDSKPHGDMVNRVIVDVDQLADGLVAALPTFTVGILTILGTVGLLFATNVGIGVAVVLLTPLSLVLGTVIARGTHKTHTARSKAQAAHTAFTTEIISNIKLARSYNQQTALCKRFGELDDNVRTTSVQAIFTSAITPPATRFIGAMIYATVVFMGAHGAINGNFTIGMLGATLGIVMQYTRPFNEISGIISALGGATASAGRVLELIVQPIEAERADAKLPEELRGEIVMRGINFSYDGVTLTLRDINLTITSGEHIALVGPTGCGKTTLISLLMRFLRHDEGEIALDGVDISTISAQLLRSKIGVVPQAPWLREGTVRENIAFGAPEATIEQVVDAAKSAHAHEFIRLLPDGYDTVISESGGQLSSGQMQLICIARIMLTNPAMLILDESVSSVDPATEVKIHAAIKSLMHGRTSIVIAHKPTFIESADRVIAMDSGEIVES